MLGSIFKSIFGLTEQPVQKTKRRTVKKPKHPRYCDPLRTIMESGRPYTLSQLQKRLGKTKGTVAHEMSQLRKAGFLITKKYDKKISAYKYRNPS
jgi:DNA-binding transcriptional ArsR family regulator